MADEIKYKVAYSATFKTDMKVLSEAEKQEVKAVVKRLANAETLEEKYRDHALNGRLNGFRDCHVRPDLVLIYRINATVLELYAYRIGTHSKLYKK